MQSHPPTTADNSAATKSGNDKTRQPLHAAQIADALLKLNTVSAISGLSQSTLYRKAATDPTFPKLVKLGNRCTRIRAGDLTAWLAAQV
jgi:prophage regulatory protein